MAELGSSGGLEGGHRLDLPVFSYHETAKAAQELLRNQHAREVIESYLGDRITPNDIALGEFLSTDIAQTSEVQKLLSHDKMLALVCEEIDEKTRNVDPEQYVLELLADPHRLEQFAHDVLDNLRSNGEYIKVQR